jgi:hypothetical protein
MVVPKRYRNSYERAVKRFWKDKCTVYVRKNVTNDETKRTKQEEVLLFEDEPCRIVFKTPVTTNDMRGAPLAPQEIKLLIDKEIPPGSKVSVLRAETNERAVYQLSGKANPYTVHREIALEVWKGWA